MNKLLLGVLACSTLMFTSCDKEDELLDNVTSSEETTGGGNQGGEVTFIATIDGTRTTVDDDGKVYWSAGDAISVLNSSNGFDRFVLSSGAGEQTASFTGSFAEGTTGGNIAVYPAGSHTYDVTTLKVNLPSSYGSTDADYIANSSALMVANKVEDGNKLYFTHLGAAVRLIINVPAGATSVSLTGKGICGDFTVGAEGKIAQSSTKFQTVTYNFKAFTAQKEETFYFPVPTGTYDQFLITVAAEDGRSATKTARFGTAKVLGRKQIAKLPTLSTIVFEDP